MAVKLGDSFFLNICIIFNQYFPVFNYFVYNKKNYFSIKTCVVHTQKNYQIRQFFWAPRKGQNKSI